MHQVVVPICPLDDWKSWHNSSVVHPYCSWQCPNVKSLLSIFFFLYPLWHLKHFLRELCNRVAIILEVFCSILLRYFKTKFQKSVNRRQLFICKHWKPRKPVRNVYLKSFKSNSCLSEKKNTNINKIVKEGFGAKNIVLKTFLIIILISWESKL